MSDIWTEKGRWQVPHHETLRMGSYYRAKKLGLICCCVRKQLLWTHHTVQATQPSARIWSASENIRTGALGIWGQEDARGFVAMQCEGKERPVAQGFIWDRALRSLFKTSQWKVWPAQFFNGESIKIIKKGLSRMKLSYAGSGSATDCTCQIPPLISDFILLGLPALSAPLRDMVYMNRNVSLPHCFFPSFHLKNKWSLARRNVCYSSKISKKVLQFFREHSTLEG